MYSTSDMIILNDIDTSASTFYHQKDRRWFFDKSNLATKNSSN